jgi:multiple sugar transport system substrate-binding protein
MPVVSVSLAAMAILGLGIGCRSQKPAAPPRPAPRWPDVTVRIACPPGPVRKLMETHAKTWARDNGATLTLDAPEDACDVVAFSPPDLPTWAAANRLRTLPDASITAAFLPLYRSRLLLWDGRSYALPLLGDGLLCVYRADVFADRNLQSAFKEKHQRDLAPPETWDEFVQIAAWMAEKRGRPSLPPLPGDEIRLDRALGSMAAPLTVRAVTGSLKSRSDDDPNRSAVFSFQYDATTGEPRIASPGFVAAADLLRQLNPYRSKKVDLLASFRDDEAVMEIVTLHELGRITKVDSMRWGVTRVPGSGRVFAPGSAPEGLINVVPYVGSSGAFGAVPTDSKCPDAAFDLLTYLCGEMVSQEVVHDPTFGCGPFRDAHLNKQSNGWFAYGLDEANTTRLREILRETADPRLDNPGIALRIPNQATHRKALVNALRRILSGNDDPSAIFKEADSQWRALDGDLTKAREMYRKSLGL